MIQVKEFVDTDTIYAEKKANEFMAGLSEDQVINVCYGAIVKKNPNGSEYQRSAILVVYRTDDKQNRKPAE